MEKEIIDILIKSGKINHSTQKYAKKIIKPDMSLMDVANKVENYIKEQNAKPAWPVNLSVNHEAAHGYYDIECPYVLKEEDILKVDVGIAIDGYITDSSQSLIFNKKHELLSLASSNALKQAKSFLISNYKKAKLSDIGKIISNEIKKSGFNVIANLTGHFIERYNQHSSPSIPNIETNIDIKFSDIDSNFAIEPFATDGVGLVHEHSSVLIFQFIEDKPIRNKHARLLLKEIEQFEGLPFSEYWIGKDMNAFDKKFALRELIKSEIIETYPVLCVKKENYVSQFETTFVYDGKELLDLVNIDEFL